METFLSQITVLIIVVVLAYTFLVIIGVLPKQGKTGGKKEGPEPNRKKGDSGVFYPYSKDEDSKKSTYETDILAFYRLDMLRIVNGKEKIIKSFSIHEIPDNGEGLRIGRSKECDIVIPEDCTTIGKKHAVISQDEKGIFLVDQESLNGVFNSDKKYQRSIDLEDNVRFYLGSQLFAFVEVDPFAVNTVDSDNSNKENTTSFRTKIRRI